MLQINQTRVSDAIPVTQTRTGPEGNCMSATLASILEIPIWEVPELGGDEEFLENIQKFLEPRGLYYVQVKPDDPVLETAFQRGEVYHTVEGVSPRGGMHACVGLNGSILWDPHPNDGSGHGLVSVECFGLLCARMDNGKREGKRQ